MINEVGKEQIHELNTQGGSAMGPQPQPRIKEKDLQERAQRADQHRDQSAAARTRHDRQAATGKGGDRAAAKQDQTKIAGRFQH